MSRAALFAGFDAVDWSGANLFSRNGTTVAAPAVATMYDNGHYPDAVGFLNGWSSARALGTQIDLQWATPGVISAGISAANRFYVQVELAGVAACSVVPGTSDPWGWGGTVGGIFLGGDTWRITANGPWTKGMFTAATATKFTLNVDANNISFPDYNRAHQSLPTWLTATAVSYADIVTQNLEKWDNDTCDNANRRFSWGLDTEGRTFTSWDAGQGNGETITWISTTLRRALGYTGSETYVLADGVYTLTSTYPARGAQVLRSGVAVLDPTIRNIGSAVSQVNGRVAARNVSTFQEVRVSTTLRGGVGLSESRAAYEDESENYRYRVAPYLFPGARCTLIPDYTDPRLGLSIAQQFENGATPYTYSTYVLGTTGGVMGRRRCEVSPESPRDTSLGFPANAPRMRTAPISWQLRLLD